MSSLPTGVLGKRKSPESDEFREEECAQEERKAKECTQEECKAKECAQDERKAEECGGRGSYLYPTKYKCRYCCPVLGNHHDRQKPHLKVTEQPCKNCLETCEDCRRGWGWDQFHRLIEKSEKWRKLPTRSRHNYYRALMLYLQAMAHRKNVPYFASKHSYDVHLGNEYGHLLDYKDPENPVMQPMHHACWNDPYPDSHLYPLN